MTCLVSDLNGSVMIIPVMISQIGSTQVNLFTFKYCLFRIAYFMHIQVLGFGKAWGFYDHD